VSARVFASLCKVIPGQQFVNAVDLVIGNTAAASDRLTRRRFGFWCTALDIALTPVSELLAALRSLHINHPAPNWHSSGEPSNAIT
jgi:hypothetical protein